jgi:membrane protein implicated in regulation of membrane protease activity
MIERILTRLNSIPADKALHFAAGVILFAVFLPFTGPQYAFALSVIAGFLLLLLLRKHHDYLDNHKP